MYSMAFIFLIVLVLIGVVYIKNDMYYINPLINILGYSFYDLEIKTKSGEVKKIKVFFKGSVKINAKYIVKDKFSNFIFLICQNDL